MYDNIFHVEWLTGCENEFDMANQSTLARLRIQCGDTCFTRNVPNAAIVDERLPDVQESTTVSLLPLAHWLAWYFFRLCHEPLPSKGVESDLDHIVAHNMAYAGSGYVFPALTIYPDSTGDNVLLALNTQQDGPAKDTQRNAACDGEGIAAKVNSLRETGVGFLCDSIIYIDQNTATVPMEDFTYSVLSLLRSVNERLCNVGIYDSDFQTLYTELRNDLSDADTRAYRKQEAILGYDPGCAPKDVMQKYSPTWT